MKNIVRILGVACIASSLLVGCTTQKSSAPTKPRVQRTSYTQRVKNTVPLPPMRGTTAPTPAPQYNKSNTTIANRLVHIAKRMPHVRNATAVSVGRYSIVGLDLDPTLDRNHVGTVKYSVAQALHKDPVGARALVTADADLVQRLKNVNKDIKQGHPMSGIMHELAAIAARIAPQPTKVLPKTSTSK